ncbi:MAG TPA: HPr kinase/phosphorylase [Phenylobacterium sp.]|nr:HPr kinase/phosphorylase [Phenylobacterium sp.]
MIRHAGLVAQRVGGVWRGVLIEGPSGGGKSDLALRALDHGFTLVADDRVELWAEGGRLFGRAPPSLAGLIEARGLGILTVTPLPLAQVALIARGGEGERMPDAETAEVLGVSVQRLAISLLEASAPAKLSRALARFDAKTNRRM